MKLSIIIPCYNEEENVEKINELITNTFKTFQGEYEIVFVDDGSKDNTIKKLKELYEKNNYVQVISFSRNFGQDKAILAGLNHAQGEYVAILDADGQQDPKYILTMYDILEKEPEYDMVAAYPIYTKEEKWKKNGRKLFYKIMGKIFKKESTESGGFRLFRKKVVQQIIRYKESFWHAKAIFNDVGFCTYYIPYQVKKRERGKTKYSLKSLIKQATEIIEDFSDIEFKLAKFLTYLTIIILVIFSLYKQENQTIKIIVVAAIALLILLLIILKYIYKMYIEIKNRPLYIIKEKLQRKTNNIKLKI